MTLCVTIATNLTDGLLINYPRIGSAFNKLSENIYFYILTLLIMAGVFDFLPSFLSVIVHPSWVSQAPRVLSYCADALLFGP